VDATRRRLLARERWSPEDLASELARLFDLRDGHLAFDFGGAAPKRAQSGRRLIAGLGPWLPDGEGEAPRGHGVTWNASDEAPTASGAPVELYPGVVPVLVIRTFSNSAEGWLRDLPGLARKLRRAPGFVIDLRGNPGGNYAFAEAFVLELSSGRFSVLDESEVMGVEALEGRLNTARYEIALGQVGADARPHYERHLRALTQLVERARAEDQERALVSRTGQVVVGRADRPYTGRLVLLADRGCASACEMMIALARQLPNAILAGEPTRGAMEVGEVATFRLPRSGVTVRMGTRRYRDPRGSFQESRGYEPDVPLAGTDALLEAMRLALPARGGQASSSTSSRR
jgi:hypothetical protein